MVFSRVSNTNRFYLFEYLIKSGGELSHSYFLPLLDSYSNKFIYHCPPQLKYLKGDYCPFKNDVIQKKVKEFCCSGDSEQQ